MTTVEIPPGSGNHYRYVYEEGATVYKGPVGNAPELSEDEFMAILGRSNLKEHPRYDTYKWTLNTTKQQNPGYSNEYYIWQTLSILSGRLSHQEMVSLDTALVEDGVWKQKAYIVEVDGKEMDKFWWDKDTTKVVRKSVLRSGEGFMGEIVTVDPRDEGISTAYHPDQNLTTGLPLFRWKEFIPGGLGAGKHPANFDPDQIRKGINVEMEHVVGSTSLTEQEKIRVAAEIATDHLMEDPKYYDKLETLGL